jgi:hypothetical protein
MGIGDWGLGIGIGDKNAMKHAKLVIHKEIMNFIIV